MVSKKQNIKTRRALAQLRELRRRGNTMRLAAEGWRTRWQTLIAILLSARTRDEVTIAVGEKLFSRYPSLRALAKARLSDIEQTIYSVNFFRNKAKSVKGCAHALIVRFGETVPHDVAGLVTLPGVGRKTANVFRAQMGESAIGVDTHVAYISRVLGWTRNTHPEKIERDIEKLFPRHYWRRVNAICVHFGKTYTKKREKDEILSDILLNS